MTSPPAAAARRLGRLGRRTLAGERRLYGTNGKHRDEADDKANSPVTKTAAEEQRTTTATRRKRRQPSGRRRRRCSGGLRRWRSGGRGRRRLGEHNGGLLERRRRLERRRLTAGATAAQGCTTLGLFRRREAKARVAAGMVRMSGVDREWLHSMAHALALDTWTWPREDVPGLGQSPKNSRVKRAWPGAIWDGLRTCERSLTLVLRMDGNLMISGISIKETEEGMICQPFQHFINEG
uniref:Uncharacterized protein n=1 Tax=Oryza sativa subsp. japonica TaxID=39947 RepID=Q8LMG7_ORYSJ|nr:Hypothetical protein [Oryza sativa Japonica Group]